MDESQPPLKRKKVSAKSSNDEAASKAKKRHVRGVKGALSELSDMPLDVLYEIFGHLEPIDLLHLARATKPLRAHLMSKSSAFIWKEARLKTNIPDIPSDLSEPEYVNLAYSKHCHFCFKSCLTQPIWHSRVRSCKPCISSHFVDQRYPGISDYRIPSITPHIGDPRVPKRRQNYTRLYLTSILKQKCESYAAYVTDETQRLEWMQTETEEFNAVVQHAKLCEEWYADRAMSRSSELSDSKVRRLQAIIAKLGDLGWGEEVENLDYGTERQFQGLKQVNQAKDLTDRQWKNMEADLLGFMQRAKAARLAREAQAEKMSRCVILRDVHAEYRSSLPADSFVPGVADFLTMALFKSLIQDTPPTTKLTAADFTAAIAQLPELCATWKRQNDYKLARMVKPELKPEDLDAINDILSLAKTVFKCSHCAIPMSYPHILVHHHAAPHERDFNIYGPDGVGTSPWTCEGDKIILHTAGIIPIIQACGLDPETATTAEIERLDPLLECVACVSVQGGKLVMRWATALEHVTKHANVAVTWKVVEGTPEDVALLARPQTPSELRYQYDDTLQFVCKRCNSGVLSAEAITAHAVSKHNVTTTVLERDIDYTDYIDPLQSVKPVRLVPGELREQDFYGVTQFGFGFSFGGYDDSDEEAYFGGGYDYDSDE